MTCVMGCFGKGPYPTNKGNFCHPERGVSQESLKPMECPNRRRVVFSISSMGGVWIVSGTTQCDMRGRTNLKSSNVSVSTVYSIYCVV